jgi:hypothetical protein
MAEVYESEYESRSAQAFELARWAECFQRHFVEHRQPLYSRALFSTWNNPFSSSMSGITGC